MQAKVEHLWCLSWTKAELASTASDNLWLMMHVNAIVLKTRPRLWMNYLIAQCGLFTTLCLCMCNMVYGGVQGLCGGSKPFGSVYTEEERGTCSILCVSSLLCLAEVHLWQMSKSQTPSPLNSLYPFLSVFLFCVRAQKTEGPQK